MRFSSFSYIVLPPRPPLRSPAAQTPAAPAAETDNMRFTAPVGRAQLREKTLSAEYPPFMFGYGMIASAIAKIQDHDIPEVFNHEYLRYTLGFSRESDRAFIPLLKRLGFLTPEGKPTALFTQLHKPKQSAAAIALAMQQGFNALYAANAQAHDLERKQLAALVVELTKLDAGHTTARAIVGTFLALKDLAGLNPPAPETDRRKTAERRKSTA